MGGLKRHPHRLCQSRRGKRRKKGKTINGSEDLGEREGKGWKAEDQGGRRGGVRKSTRKH